VTVRGSFTVSALTNTLSPSTSIVPSSGGADAATAARAISR
jgi:hypothetical protein